MALNQRRIVYDCTPFHLERADFLKNLLSYKKLELVQADFESCKEQEDALVILVDPAESSKAFQHYRRFAKDAEQLGVIDTVFFEGNRYWPNVIYKAAFGDLVFSKVPSLNIKLRCYLAGDHALIEPAIFALSKLGYSDIVWITREPESARTRIDRIQRMLLGLNLTTIDTSELTLQSNNGSLILNGVTDLEEIDLLDDLAYLNFLQPPGMIIDLNCSQPVEWGASEDQSTGYPIGTARDLRRCYDSLVMKEIQRILSIQP
jgi:hypothetical protein